MIAVEIGKYLAQEIAGLTYDDSGSTGNVYVGMTPDSPDDVVMVKGSGGEGNDTKLGYDAPTIQVIVRGGPAYDRTAGYNRAREVYDVLAGLTSTALPDGTWLVMARALASEPADIGADENGRQEWSMNFLLEVRALTQNRE